MNTEQAETIKGIQGFSLNELEEITTNVAQVYTEEDFLRLKAYRVDDGKLAEVVDFHTCEFFADEGFNTDIQAIIEKNFNLGNAVYLSVI